MADQIGYGEDDAESSGSDVGGHDVGDEQVQHVLSLILPSGIIDVDDERFRSPYGKLSPSQYREFMTIGRTSNVNAVEQLECNGWNGKMNYDACLAILQGATELSNLPVFEWEFKHIYDHIYDHGGYHDYRLIRLECFICILAFIANRHQNTRICNIVVRYVINPDWVFGTFHKYEIPAFVYCSVWSGHLREYVLAYPEKITWSRTDSTWKDVITILVERRNFNDCEWLCKSLFADIMRTGDCMSVGLQTLPDVAPVLAKEVDASFHNNILCRAFWHEIYLGGFYGKHLDIITWATICASGAPLPKTVDMSESPIPDMGHHDCHFGL